MPTRKDRPPLAALLHNNGRPIDPMTMAADILRNGPSIARLGGPLVPIVAPLAGRPMEAAMVEFIAYLYNHFLSTAEERKAARRGTPPARRPGQHFNFHAWISSSIIMLKSAQVELSCRGSKKIVLVDKYLALPGPFQDRSGVNIETLKEWKRRGTSLKSEMWTKENAALLTSFFIPKEVSFLDAKLRRAFLESLRGKIEHTMEEHLGTAFPVQFFGLFLDFSQHSDEDLRRLIRAISPLIDLAPPERLLRLRKALHPAIESVEDLIGDDGLPPEIQAFMQLLAGEGGGKVP